MTTKRQFCLQRYITLKNMKHIVLLFLVILSILAIIKSIFLSFDIDEGYGIAQAYRLIKGDRLFAEMWESHQLSAFLSAIFMYPFLEITGSTAGVVLYLRIIGSIIHLLIGIWFYQVARKQFSSTTSLLISLVHINFLPKWVSIPEFEIMHYWAVCIIFLALYSWNQNRRKKYFLIIASVALWIAILSYPTMIVLYPAYLAAIAFLTRGDRRIKWQSIFWFTIPVFLLGIAF